MKTIAYPEARRIELIVDGVLFPPTSLEVVA